MSINLQKGQKIDLTKGNAGLDKIFVGLGWDPVQKPSKGLLITLEKATIIADKIPPTAIPIFEELAKSKLKVTSSDRIYVTFDIRDLRRPKEVYNSGIYYETNLSSNSICYFIKTLIECFELDVNEFEFTIE